MKVSFLNPEKGLEYTREMTAEEFKVIVEMKPEIYLDGNAYETDGEFQYNIEFGQFQIIVFESK
ncbi:hypothetical protein [Paenibacillus macerans]|uniref:hypothetical protein n=1 Tax=Paenibacillus macerans TaxID=44252 RepID=UPI0020401B0C|nr:hypothetical protein [Paenibacillus macerans]MCM3701450.1 hypothetical protein [Paenibacillus macerans]